MRRKKFGWVLGGLIVLVIAGGALAAHSRFTDVTHDHPVEAIEWAADNEITLGYGDGTFRPDEPLRRSHALIFMARFYDQVLGANGDDQFSNPDFTRADMMALLHSMVADEVEVTTTTTTTTTPPPSGTCTHWHAGHPKHTHPGTNHDGTHESGKCAGY